MVPLKLVIFLMNRVMEMVLLDMEAEMLARSRRTITEYGWRYVLAKDYGPAYCVCFRRFRQVNASIG